MAGEKDEVSTEDLFNEFAGTASTPEKSDYEKEQGDLPEDEEGVDLDEGVDEETDPDKGVSEKDVDEKGSDKPEDIWEKASEEQRTALAELQAQNAKLANEVKAMKGRVPGLQRKLTELEKQQQQAKVTPEDFAKAFVDQDSWKEFSRTNPEFAQPLEQFMKGFAESVMGEVGETSKRQQELEKTLSADEEAKVDAQITSKYTDWKTWISTKEWTNWLAEQPSAIHSIVTDGDTDDTIWLLGQFEKHLQATKPASPPSKKDKEVSNLQEKRDKQLKDGATTPSKSGSATPISDDNTESLFDFYTKQKTA